MYSYEDRIRAVKLYIKLGKRTGPTIRQLGYPTKNALKSWHREYEHSHDLQVGYVRSRQKYSTEQKQAAHPLDCGRPANPNTPGNSKTGGHRHDERHPVRRLNAADLKNRAGV